MIFLKEELLSFDFPGREEGNEMSGFVIRQRNEPGDVGKDQRGVHGGERGISF
jgi:hypothetical protein